ncbi:GNAT family N-acetyltransferase [Jiulongibacter sediminis]|jgi:ribosomal protein S18 acetylase RimI-like enzyme|uniref:GNAT family N-acetyltransferase n=1 Tax=Jiulongibacter sediminis TaxID=1605367 RepID=UPI0026ECA092|nr:GNAT family N-acetyltransferase [Jiulongibacter sediminis]
MPFRIRLAVFQDIEELDLLINSAFRGDSSRKGWTTEADLLDGIRTDQSQLKTFIEEPDSDIWIYEEDGRALGCIHLRYRKDHIYLGMFTVSPSHQGLGIGKTLMKFSEEKAIELKTPKMEITVLTLRTDLIAWYERHGYVRTGEIRPFPMDNPDFGLPKVFLELAVLVKEL